MPGKARVLRISSKKKGGENRGLLWSARVFSTPSEHRRGIIGEKKNFSPALFVFARPTRLGAAIHAFFCPPFDAVFLDEKMVVVDSREVKPFSPLVVPPAACKYLIELPAGQAASSKIRAGEKLLVQFWVGGKWKSI